MRCDVPFFIFVWMLLMLLNMTPFAHTADTEDAPFLFCFSFPFYTRATTVDRALIALAPGRASLFSFAVRHDVV